MGVDLTGNVAAGMLEALADDFDVDAFGEGESCLGVAEAVEHEPGQRLVRVSSVVLLLPAANSAR